MMKFFKKWRLKKPIVKYITAEQFYIGHKYCPQCLISSFTSTKLTVKRLTNVDFFDNVNKVQCKKCKWKGHRYQMISYNEMTQILKGKK